MKTALSRHGKFVLRTDYPQTHIRTRGTFEAVRLAMCFVVQ